jgi:hypothetical protein
MSTSPDRSQFNRPRWTERDARAVIAAPRGSVFSGPFLLIHLSSFG